MQLTENCVVLNKIGLMYEMKINGRFLVNIYLNFFLFQCGYC